MSKHPKYDLYIADRKAGMTYTQIGQKHGVSRKSVECVLRNTGKDSDGHRFRPFTEETCIYPNLRRWLNENQLSMQKFALLIGRKFASSNSSSVGLWLRGKSYPIKENIDRILQVTGLTYEELFATEEVK